MGEACVSDVIPRSILQSKNLPSLPAVAADVIRLSRDENAEIGDLAEVISLDPALATKILQLANSPKYRRGQSVTTVNRACVVLGMKTVRIMALSFSLANNLRNSAGSKAFDYAYYWRHSIRMAVAGRDLSRLVKLTCQDEAFFCGLIGRIGQMTLANAVPEEYEKVVRRSGRPLPSPDLEREILGCDHHTVAGQLLTTWNLPEVFTTGVQNWSRPEQIEDEQLRTLCQVLRIADSIAALIGDDDKGESYHQLQSHSLNEFGLASEETDKFIVSLDEEIATLASILNVELNDSCDPQQLLDDARQ